MAPPSVGPPQGVHSAPSRAPATTSGSSGSTHGDSVPRAPAAKPRKQAPMPRRAARLESAREERADLGGVGAERGARALGLAVERDEGAAVDDLQLLERGLVA